MLAETCMANTSLAAGRGKAVGEMWKDGVPRCYLEMSYAPQGMMTGQVTLVEVEEFVLASGGQTVAAVVVARLGILYRIGRWVNRIS